MQDSATVPCILGIGTANPARGGGQDEALAAMIEYSQITDERKIKLLH